ncbi:hypothetical protein GOV14_00290 [Candidatus Pacearchaeota archaeon]|nr:hypothetical protein [Candidatus Pacearchaeota archaeon]
MKKFPFYTILMFTFLFMISSTLAMVVQEPETAVCGWIYDAYTLEDITGADVVVECIHDDQQNVIETKTIEWGEYCVTYDSTQCGFGDTVFVNATKGDMYGSDVGEINETDEYMDGNMMVRINFGIVDVPMVPEFGLIIAGLTLISSICIFFVIRRR